MGPIPHGPIEGEQTGTETRGIFGATIAPTIFVLAANCAATQKLSGILRQYFIGISAMIVVSSSGAMLAELTGTPI